MNTLAALAFLAFLAGYLHPVFCHVQRMNTQDSQDDQGSHQLVVNA
ncbi:hypothetical protein CA54_46820 [Symmachiella macrocystis]|uniref:Uncharacterized protein n=1 Tax=Symmachiella macrocystis TaxID=2527985 RepID=A0A5C6BBY6_9PLAN|nr:hypothetical protein [Symmachiella macrocystis]TWU09440.1 hypothetical protein CA54_46820 [Symmachiella macrocystis]